MRLLERITLVLAVIVLISSAGCAKRIGATYDPFAIFPATAQWAWDEELNRIPEDQSMTALNIRTLVRETITEVLARRGYVKARSGEKVDFRVHYQVGTGKRVKPYSVKGYSSLSLTFVEVSTNRDVWVGFVKANVDVSISAAKRRMRLLKQVNKMLRKFPPT